MAARLDYRWHLRQVMAGRGMFATTDLIGPLADRGIRLSSSQVYRLVTERPERLSLKILMALLDILDCTMTDLIEPAPAAGEEKKKKKASAAGAEAGVGGLRPRRARITRSDDWARRGSRSRPRPARRHGRPDQQHRARPQPQHGRGGGGGCRRRPGEAP
ncbi:MAG: helix-turn-helix domain-containing protein [Streptosporangiaceae bacterium]